jgi:hypothetical protein
MATGPSQKTSGQVHLCPRKDNDFNDVIRASWKLCSTPIKLNARSSVADTPLYGEYNPQGMARTSPAVPYYL